MKQVYIWERTKVHKVIGVIIAVIVALGGTVIDLTMGG